MLEGTRIGTCANAEGFFQIDSIPAGQYRLLISLAGYKKTREEITISSEQQRPLVLKLSEEAYQYNPVTVTATRQRSTVSEVPASVEIISLGQLQSAAPQTITDALQAVAGVYTKDYGSVGDMKTISIRGSTSSQVLVLLDGQRLNSAQSGDVDLSTIPIAGVERIEVVRGSASALYGTDAVGGVINIITKRKPVESQMSLTASTVAGSFGTYGADIGGSYSRDTWYSLLTYKYLTSEGDFEYVDHFGTTIRRANADFTSHSLFFRTNWSSGVGIQQKSLSASAQLFQSKGGNPGSIDQPNPIARKKTTTESINFVYDQKLFSDYDNVQVQAYVHNSEFNYDDDYQYVPIHSYNHNMAVGTELQSQIIIAPWQTLTGGYAYRRDMLFNTGAIGEQNRWTHSLYGQTEISYAPKNPSMLRRLVTIPALRWDKFSDFGDQISPKISFLASFGEEWQVSLKSNYGYSFRAPSFNDLYWPRDAWTVGNLNLKPETGHDFDLGMLARFPSLLEMALDVTYFQNSVQDMIVWLQGQTLWSPQNIGRAELNGIEMKLGVSPLERFLRLEWNYTYLSSRDETDKPNEKGNVLPYRPRHNQNVRAALTLGDVTVSGVFSYTSKVYTNVANTTSMPEHSTFDAVLAYTLPVQGCKMIVKFEGKNLGNNAFEIMEGYPMPGREFRLSAEVNVQELLSVQ